MTADEAGVVFSTRQEIDFLEEVQRFCIIAIDPIQVPIEFLREGDQHAEVSSLRQLGQFESLQLTNALSSHAGSAEVFGGASCGVIIAARDELAILEQVLRHPDVFAAHRAVGDLRTDVLFRDIARLVPGTTVLLMIVSSGLNRLM